MGHTVSAMAATGWYRRAACRGLDPELFFPERGASTKEAKAVCTGCPVQAECLTTHLGEKYGVWAETSERQRRRARNGLLSVAGRDQDDEHDDGDQAEDEETRPALILDEAPPEPAVPARACEECGARFTATTPRRFCTKSCATKATNRRRWAQQQAAKADGAKEAPVPVPVPAPLAPAVAALVANPPARNGDGHADHRGAAHDLAELIAALRAQPALSGAPIIIHLTGARIEIGQP